MLLKDNLKGLQHIGLPVTNLEKSKNFYMKFGFSEAMNIDIPEQNENIKVSMLQLDNLMIELYQPPKEQCNEMVNKNDGHIDHLALNVMDINKAYLEIKEANLEIIEENPPVFLPFWNKGVKFFTVRGPDGEKIEFNQILK